MSTTPAGWRAFLRMVPAACAFAALPPQPAGAQVPAARQIRDINKVLALPDVKAHIEGQEGGAIRQAPPEALADLLRADIAKWDRVIKEAKISLE